MFLFKKKLQELDKTESQLPEEIKDSIKALEDMGLEAEELTPGDDDDDEIRQIQIDIKTLDNEIATAIEDYFDDELDAGSTDEEKREEILATLYEKGTKSVTLTVLKNLGYAYPGEITHAKAGGYRLEKPEAFRKDYKIIKL